MSDEFSSDEVDIGAAAPEVDKPNDDAEAPGAPGQAERSQGEESFTGFDPSTIPDNGADPEWLKEQYGLMRKDYTQKMQEMGDTRRNAEQLQKIFDEIKSGDPQTVQYHLSQLGVDQKRALEAYGLEIAQQEAEEQAQDPEFDDLGFKDERVDQLLAREQAREQQEAQRAEEAQLDQYADETGQKMEEELKAEFGGKEPNDKASKWILSVALDNPDQLGNPDVKGAVAEYRELMEADRQSYLDSRMGPRANGTGVPGSERFDTSTKEGRLALGASGAARARSSAQ